MNTTKKSLATATIAATALAGFSFALAPAANASSAAATKSFSKSFTQTCQQVGPLTDQKLGATVSGTVPTTVKRGAAFKLTNTKIKVTVPANINTILAGSGITTATVTFSVVNINNVDLAPTVKDTVATNITTAKIPVVPGKPSNFVAPKAGTLPAVALKGGAKAGTATIKSGAVKSTFQGYDKTGAKVGGPQTVSCAAVNAVLTTIKVS